MTKKDKIEALKRQLILHPSYLTIIEEIEKDLERLESLERENELLKRDLKEYQEYIKKGVEEHYKDFMSNYDLLLQENYELNKSHLIGGFLLQKTAILIFYLFIFKCFFIQLCINLLHQYFLCAIFFVER